MGLSKKGFSVYELFSMFFALFWFIVVSSNILVGAFQRILISMDTVGFIILTYDVHSDITKAIDPESDDKNFFKNDRWIKILFVFVVIGWLIIWTSFFTDHESATTVFDEIVFSVFGAETFGLLSMVIFMLTSAWVMGGYTYLKEPEKDGAMHRVVHNIATSTLHDADKKEEMTEWIEETFVRGLDIHIQFGRVVQFQMVVGSLLSLTAATLGVAGYILLTSPIVTLTAIVVWIAYDLVKMRRTPGEPSKILRRLDKATEAPQRLLLDFEIMNAGPKGVWGIAFVVAGAGISVLHLSVLTRFSVAELPPVVSSNIFNNIVLTANTVLLVLFIIAGVSLMIYSFITWYAILNRFSGWVSPDIRQDSMYPRLPWKATAVYPIAHLVYFGFMTRLVNHMLEIDQTDYTIYGISHLSSKNIPEAVSFDLDIWLVINIAVAVVMVLFYMLLAYQAYRSAKIVYNYSHLRLEYDNYRVPLFLLTYFVSADAFFIATQGHSPPSLILMYIFYLAVILVYFTHDAHMIFKEVTQSNFVADLLHNTYLLLVMIVVLVYGNAGGLLSLKTAAVLAGISGGLLYSVNIVEYIFWK